MVMTFGVIIAVATGGSVPVRTLSDVISRRSSRSIARHSAVAESANSSNSGCISSIVYDTGVEGNVQLKAC